MISLRKKLINQLRQQVRKRSIVFSSAEAYTNVTFGDSEILIYGRSRGGSSQEMLVCGVVGLDLSFSSSKAQNNWDPPPKPSSLVYTSTLQVNVSLDIDIEKSNINFITLQINDSDNLVVKFCRRIGWVVGFIFFKLYLFII